MTDVPLGLNVKGKFWKKLFSECARDFHCPADKPACNQIQHQCVGKLLIHCDLL